MDFQSTLTIPRAAMYCGRPGREPGATAAGWPDTSTHLEKDEGTTEKEANRLEALLHKDAGRDPRNRAEREAAEVEAALDRWQVIPGCNAGRAWPLHSRSVRLCVWPGCRGRRGLALNGQADGGERDCSSTGSGEQKQR